MRILKPILQDIPKILPLWEEQYEYHHHLDPEYYVNNSTKLKEKFEEYLAEAIINNEPNMLVAEDEGKLIGFITYDEESESYFDTNISNYGVVIELLVTKDKRGRGAGKLLMQEVENYFEQKGLKYIKLQVSTFNTPALGFYEHIGYTNRQSLLFKKL